jgi:hypothetical protein
MLNPLAVAYIQFMIMLIKLQKVLYQEVECLLPRLSQFYQNEQYQNLWMQIPYIFIALEINILYRNVCILY